MMNNDQKNERINARISEIRAYFCKNSNIIFAEKLKISTSRASNLCNTEGNIGKSTINKILETFPQVSRSWLILGEGSMLKDGEPEANQQRTNSEPSATNHPATISMPIAVWNVIEMQAESLRVRDEQMQQVINILADREAREAESARREKATQESFSTAMETSEV